MEIDILFGTSNSFPVTCHVGEKTLILRILGWNSNFCNFGFICRLNVKRVLIGIMNPYGYIFISVMFWYHVK